MTRSRQNVVKLGSRFRRTRAFEALEPRLALAVDLGLGSLGAFESISGGGGVINAHHNTSASDGLVLDVAGNRYVTVHGFNGNGVDYVADLDPEAGVTSVLLDAGLVKLDPAGATLWRATFDATSTTSTPVMRLYHAVDADQNVYIVGDFRGTVDFDPGAGSALRTSSQSGAAYSFYMLKLNSAGQLQWLNTWNATEYIPQGIAVDDAGSILLSTRLASANGSLDVDPGPGQTVVTAATTADLLLLKYNSAGGFVWARQIGGSQATLQHRNGIAVDSQGGVYVSSRYTGTLDLNPDAGTQLVANPDSEFDAFVVKLAANGDFAWAYATEGTGGAAFQDLDISYDGSVVASGWNRGTVDYAPGAGSVLLTGVGTHPNGLALKLTPQGALDWVRQFGSPGETTAHEVDVDAAGNVYIGGAFGRIGTNTTADFDPGPGVHELALPSSGETAFAVSLTGSGDFRWAAALGGNSGRSQVQGLRVTPGGSVFVTGAFVGQADFDPRPDSEVWLNGGVSSGVFLAELTQTEADPGAPVVSAGPSQTILISSPALLDGTASDDELPGPLVTTWSMVSGPGDVVFDDPASVDTFARFSSSGSYVLKLAASDGLHTSSDYVSIEVSPLGASLVATADASIDTGKATTNYGSATTLTVDGKPDLGAMLRWNLSGVPAGSTLKSAALSLNVTGASAVSFEIYEVNRAWTESQVTWKKATSAVNWQSAGAQGALDRGTTVLGTILASSTGVRTIVLNAAGLAVVQKWLDNPATNFGFAIQDYANSADDDLQFMSREAA